MSEPLRTGHAQAGPLSDADREARIEQLLLSGLDHYFSGKHEQAINIWTRVAFLERGHGRARAYIERARSALAEQQREDEALLHQGVEAYHAGNLDTARDLLTRAVEQGGPSDTALVFLQRLSRVDAPSGAVTAPRTARAVSPVPPAPVAGRSRMAVTLLASVAVAAAILVAAMPLASWLAERPVSAPPAEAASAEALPIVRPSDLEVARARQLSASGHPREALRALDRLDLADPARAEADRLRAALQRELLATIPAGDRAGDPNAAAGDVAPDGTAR
jgi:tetratricopeptide (TPR) repeat protein